MAKSSSSVIRTRCLIRPAVWACLVTLFVTSFARADEDLDDLRNQLAEQSRLLNELRERFDAGQTPDPLTMPPAPDRFDTEAAVSAPEVLPQMRGVWRNGLHIESEDRAFRIHPTGRLMLDFAWMQANDQVQFGPGGVGHVQDGVAFRRFRVGVEGTMWEIINFQFEPDYLNTVNTLAPNGTTQTTTVVVPIDNWVEVTRLPILGNVRLGSVKPEYELEHLTSSNNLDFMERSLVFDAFVGGLDNGFQPGMVIYNHLFEERVRIASSFTKNNQSIFGFNLGGGEYNAVMRVSGLPVYTDEGRTYVHIGCSYSHKDLDNGRYRFRSRTGIRNGPAALHTVLADTVLFGDSIDMIIPELAVIYGPLSIVAEYAGVWTNGVNQADLGFGRGTLALPGMTTYYQGFHAEALYFLTGEYRPYNRRMGFLDRPIPRRNFLAKDGTRAGIGAWQVGARYSEVNFNSKGVNGGIIRDVALGLNWYLNPNLKIQWNVTMTERDVPNVDSNGWIYGFGTRMALQF